MDIKKIFVAGAGLMGGGITQVCAQAGYDVTMRDITEEILEKSLKAIQWSVGKLVEKGRVEGSADEIMARIKTTTELSDAADARPSLKILKPRESCLASWTGSVRITLSLPPTPQPYRSLKLPKPPGGFRRWPARIFSARFL